ncbi:AAA family ATPase [Natronolimnobius baerhuensis]|uniref:Kinase n=1 Tax=Natronolimnobius baerhuensis TaxID=253108 RepID=A0A202E4W3_9EURY|nr:AAA family ATPase [Natronolimnobius baerhuensis]OVE83333.1 kinase [Natronolimnobius baerhuensis]
MPRQRLLVYCGLPGVGKSAASAYTADQCSATRYRTDEIRKQLFDDPEYTAEETATTYDELFDRARRDLEAGETVVCDATFRSQQLRARAADLADAVGVGFDIVHVTCDSDIVIDRIESRTDSVSDADVRVHNLVRDSFEPIERDHVVIDNSGTLEETYRQIDHSILAVSNA